MTGLRRLGNKLVATLSNVPERPHALIQKGRYKRVSAELARDFSKSPRDRNLKSGV